MGLLPPPPVQNMLGANAAPPAERWLNSLHALVNALPQVQYVPATATAAELQAAIDAGGAIILGPGTLSLGTTTININGPCNIRGCGEGVTVLTYTGSGTAFQINSGEGVETLRPFLADFTLDGTNAVSGGAIGITLGQTSASPLSGGGAFERLTVKRFSTAGVKFVVSVLGTWFRCTFESCRDGIWATNDYSNGVTTQSFIASRFVTCTKRGAFVEQYDTCSFTNTCQFEDNGEEGLLVKHPGGATAVTRNLQLSQFYAEDNGTAGAFSDIRFDNASTQSHQNCKVSGGRFQGSNADGNLYLGKGSFLEEDNEFSPLGVTNVIALSSTVCFAHGRSIRAPSTYWTAGANAPTTHERRGGDGTMRQYTNISGTITEAVSVAASGQTTLASLASGAWQTFSFSNSWVDASSLGNPVAGYRKLATGNVQMRGAIKDGTTVDGTIWATLPAGYRPTGKHVFLVISQGAACIVDINTSGELKLFNAPGTITNTELVLDQITFPTT